MSKATPRRASEEALEPIPEQLVSHLPDADMQAVPRALMRAARSARELARRTGTKLVFVRDGVLVEESAEEIDKPGSP
jgi:hypothetical protein